MRRLTPIQVLTVIAMRLETRARVLEDTRLKEYEVTIHELRHFAGMVRRAIEYARNMSWR